MVNEKTVYEDSGGSNVRSRTKVRFLGRQLGEGTANGEQREVTILVS